MLRLLVWILEWEPNNLPFLHQAAKIIWDKVETKGRSKSPAIAHGKSNWRKNRVQYISSAGTFEKLKHLINFLLLSVKVFFQSNYRWVARWGIYRKQDTKECVLFIFLIIFFGFLAFKNYLGMQLFSADTTISFQIFYFKNPLFDIEKH